MSDEQTGPDRSLEHGALREVKLQAEQVVEQARAAAREIVDTAERRSMQLVEESKAEAKREAKRLLEWAKQEADAEFIKHGLASGERIERMIEFPPELRQAGISILSYFSEVLREKHPNHEVAVRIEQFGTKVRLIIDSPTGLKESIERDLREYGHVVVGSRAPETFLHSREAVLRLNNKLELARVELQLTQRLLSYVESESKARIDSLESQVQRLHHLVGASLSNLHDSFGAFASLVSEHGNNAVVQEALRTLQLQLANSAASLDVEATKQALSVLKERDPSVLKKAYDLLSSTVAGTAGNLIATLIESLFK